MQCAVSCRFKGDIVIKQVGDSNGTADRLMKLEIPSGDFFIVIVGNPDLSVNLCAVSDLYRRKECCCAMVLKKNNEHKIDNNKVGSSTLVSIGEFGVWNNQRWHHCRVRRSCISY